MKKGIILAAAVALLLSGCGAKQEETLPIDVDAAAQTILESVEFQDTLVKAEGGAAEMFYKNLDENVSDYAIYISGSGSTAEEIAVLRCSDTGSGKAVAEKRVEDLKFQFEDYVPKEMTKLSDVVIVEKGDIVILVIADDSSQAQVVANELLQ